MSRKGIILFFLVTLCLGGYTLAQNLGGISIPDLSTINVDELSDDQVRSLIERAQASGYTQSQLEVLARARGLSELQISKLRERILSLNPDETVVADIERLRTEPLEETSSDPFEIFQMEEEEEKSEVFGRSIFNNPQISFEPSYNIPTPENYLLGPGDEVIIDVWGASEQNYQLLISPEGAIRIPNLGPVYLNGLTMQAAKRRILNRLKQIYSSLGQNTFGDVSLGQLKTIKVSIVGEVVAPGSYSMSSFGTVYNALYMAGGPNENGSLRSIEVYRNGDKIEEIDLFAFLFDGQQSNQILRDQDVILIKTYDVRVEVVGEVKRPMIYELKPEETVDDLLRYSGGFSKNAFKSELTINRVDGIRKRIQTVSDSDFGLVELKDGDEVVVGNLIDEFANRVVISGAVYREGAFELTEGLTLSSLIAKAEGLKPDAFRGRGLVWRENSNKTLRNISFPVSEVVSNSWDLTLNSNDSIIIQSIFDLQDSLKITVDGEVRFPGELNYVDSTTVEDVIFISGGFKETAARSFVEVSRRLSNEGDEITKSSEVFNFAIDANLNLSDEASSFHLEPFDLVVVRRSPTFDRQEIVEVEGEVKFPGVYAIEKNDERISDLLRRAGGLSNNAYPKGATLIRRTEYFAYEDEESTDIATRIRREDLGAIFERDTLSESGKSTFKRQESIGIDLIQILDSPGSKYDLILKEGDILSIPKELQTVRVRGEVLYPSTVRYDGASSLRYYLSQAGGVSDNAKISKAYVVYPNGSAARTKRFLWFKGYPKIDPGAEIIVPKRPQRRKLSPQEILGLSSSILGMILIIDRLAN